MSIPNVWEVATAAPVAVTVDGKAHSFKRLARDEVRDFIAKWSAEDRRDYVAALDESRIAGPDRFDRLRRFDSGARTLSYGDACVYELQRCREVVDKSAILSGIAPEVVASLPARTVDALARVVWGLEDVDVADTPHPKA